LEKYGWRVGIFEKMEVDLLGNWVSVSKTLPTKENSQMPN
jgi:hypothetical protein